MDDLNFTIPAAKPGFDAKVALKYFKAAGSALEVTAGTTLFVEHEKSNLFLLQHDKMYFLVTGEVDLSVNKTPVWVVRNGEIFGEMGLITGMPRTATAQAITDCRLYTLDKDQLLTALRTAPEFGLLLMSIMITRLRDTITALSANGILSVSDELKDSGVFDKKLLEKLVNELDDSARIRCAANRIIVKEGQAGVLTYVVLEGRVEIAIHDNVVATIGPGGLFGEMALITRGERVASAKAITDCELLAINRNVFLDLVGSNPVFAVSLLEAVGNRARFMASHRT
jgi:CRP/FNR family transcriptional regulator, cyclic AMP receptor protein